MSSAIDAQIHHERRQALRALLRRPLLAASGPHAAAFLLVRRHAPALRDWLGRYPRWMLRLDPEQARLCKIPGDLAGAARPALDTQQQTPFTRRCYVLFCLSLAALEGEDRQTTLGRLADRVISYFAAEPALGRAGTFGLDSQDQRRDLVRVVRFLLDLRVLVRVAGEEQGFIADRTRDVLYNVSRPALASVLNVRRAPSMVEATNLSARIASIVEEHAPDSSEAKNQALRAHIYRRLLDDPVVYYADLTPEEHLYLTRQRPFILASIEDATGLVAEVRREGIAMVDPQGDLTDVALPEEGTEGHLTLLLAEWLAGCARTGRRVGLAAAEQHTAELICEHRGRWKKAVQEPGAEVALAKDALDRLAALDLLRLTAEGIEPRAAIARYAVLPVQPARPVPAENLLLDLTGRAP
jgi:uncharacterized protein (TIGR02678 family)